MFLDYLCCGFDRLNDAGLVVGKLQGNHRDAVFRSVRAQLAVKLFKTDKTVPINSKKRHLIGTESSTAQKNRDVRQR